MVENNAPRQKPSQDPTVTGSVQRAFVPQSTAPIQKSRQPEKQELDTLSFLQVEKEKAMDEFNEKNTMHRKMLAEIDVLKAKANEVRDEVLRIHGSMQRLDAMIEKAKGITK